jgi:hypothetical protein
MSKLDANPPPIRRGRAARSAASFVAARDCLCEKFLSLPEAGLRRSALHPESNERRSNEETQCVPRARRSGAGLDDPVGADRRDGATFHAARGRARRRRRGDLGGGDEGRRAERPYRQGRGAHRFGQSERGAEQRRPGGQLVPAHSLSERPDKAAWLQAGQRGHDLHLADCLLLEEVQGLQGPARQRQARHSRRPEQPDAGARGAARPGRAHTARRLRSRAGHGHAEGRDGLQEEGAAGGGRLGGARSLAGRRGCVGHRQHLCLPGRADRHARRHRGGEEGEQPVREHHRRARERQGRCVGQAAGKGLPVGRGSQVHPDQVPGLRPAPCSERRSTKPHRLRRASASTTRARRGARRRWPASTLRYRNRRGLRHHRPQRRRQVDACCAP